MHATSRPASLWLALRFWRLPLEVFGAQHESAVAVAQHRVVCANAAAAEAGVESGMRLAAALAMAPGVSVVERAPLRESAALAQLACWAGSFSPEVCLAPPDELLIEIGGCLRLFGGLAPLLDGVRAGLAAQGFSAALALAATPLAAQWRVRALTGELDDAALRAPADLRAALSVLPVTVIGFSAAELKTLAALGVQQLGDLWALPSAGLARRFGPRLPLWLAQALGEVADPRERFVFPETFAQRLELPAKVEVAAMLLFAARRLLASLAGWLAARASGVAQCVLQCHHDEGAPTAVALAFSGPTHDLQRMERVLRERLERLVLREPVVELWLLADAPEQMPGSSLGLFAQAATQSLDPVIERLRARLGEAAVHGLAMTDDYRPERATRALQAGEAALGRVQPGPPRPLWLLPCPQALRESAEGLWHAGSLLQRLAGPERIESGWWDSGEGVGDVRRDYYVALSGKGEWLWIFRDVAGWWVHGFFA